MKAKRNILKSAVAKVVSASGGDKLVDYASSKIAKRMVSPDVAKHVDDRTSGKEALGSAAQVVMTGASVAGAGALAKGVASAAAKRGVAKSVASRRASDIARMDVQKREHLKNALKTAKEKSTMKNEAATFYKKKRSDLTFGNLKAFTDGGSEVGAFNRRSEGLKNLAQTVKHIRRSAIKDLASDASKRSIAKGRLKQNLKYGEEVGEISKKEATQMYRRKRRAVGNNPKLGEVPF